MLHKKLKFMCLNCHFTIMFTLNIKIVFLVKKFFKNVPAGMSILLLFMESSESLYK